MFSTRRCLTAVVLFYLALFGTQANAAPKSTHFTVVHAVGASGARGNVMSSLSANTDAEGRWHLDTVPKDARDMPMRLAHPDYISDENYGATPKPPMEALRAQTAVSVMKKGVEVTGT